MAQLVTVKKAATSGAGEARGRLTRLAERLLMDATLTYRDIAKVVVAEFPNARTSARSIASVAALMRRKGIEVPTRPPSWAEIADPADEQGEAAKATLGDVPTSQDEEAEILLEEERTEDNRQETGQAAASGVGEPRGRLTRLVESLLMDATLTYRDIVKIVAAEFPNARTSARSIASVAAGMRRKGVEVPTHPPSWTEIADPADEQAEAEKATLGNVPTSQDEEAETLLEEERTEDNHQETGQAAASGVGEPRGRLTRLVESLLMDAAFTYRDIVKIVAAEFPKARTSTRSIAAVAAGMRRKGVEVPAHPRSRAKIGLARAEPIEAQAEAAKAMLGDLPTSKDEDAEAVAEHAPGPATAAASPKFAARGFDADPDEGADFLAVHPEIQFIETLFTSLGGVPRGKRLRRDGLAKLYGGEAFVPSSIVAVDILGADCEDSGLVWETGDADCLMTPVPGRIVPAPWLGDDVAQVMCSLKELDGAVNRYDPRAVLARVLDRFAADGLTPVVACELEFYLVEFGDGAVRLRRSPLTGREPFGNEAHGLSETEDAADFLRALWASADAQGLPLEGVSSEASPGQLELTLHHRDALGAGDDAVSFKRAAKGVARTLGCEATFMAKPFAGIAGSGMHVHISVLDADGDNIFAADAPEGTPALGHVIAGMAATMAEAMAVLAPNANSYRRYAPRSYAPTAPIWGVDNRTVALRIPAGGASSRRVEHRVAGADANPYLVLAVVLAGAHHGITQRIDPGARITGDGYAAAAKSGAKLPTDWVKAIDLFAASEVMRDYLGDVFVDLFATVKRTEQARFNAVVTPLDYDWYLQNA